MDPKATTELPPSTDPMPASQAGPAASLAWWARRGGAQTLGGLGGFGMGKSRAKRYDPGSAARTTFPDVAGIEDVKNEVTEIVDFLRNPERYRKHAAVGVCRDTAPAAMADSRAG
jgi:hypothetical protein